jgi:hypothetical protein
MRLPRFRIRTLMIAVAVVAIPLGAMVAVAERRQRFMRMATAHWRATVAVQILENGTANGVVEHYLDARGVPLGAQQQARDKWHETMAEKYRQAARRPWLPVPPDPPEPK